MRLQLTFVLLLLTSSTATSLAWRNFARARSGDALGQALVFVAATIAVLSFTLLARIIVTASRRSRLR